MPHEGKRNISERAGITCIPRDLILQGYKGRVPLLADGATVVLIHPRASLNHVEESLETILKDVRLSKQLANTQEMRFR